MRVTSGSRYSSKSPHHAVAGTEPRTGTRLRDLYDLFRANAGCPVAVPAEFKSGDINQLKDFYGMSLKHVGGSKGRTYMLVGEYVGAEYHDYINNRIVHQRDL